MNENLKKSILLTLSYFDRFDYPLTIDELRSRLFDVSVSSGIRGEDAKKPETKKMKTADYYDEFISALSELIDYKSVEAKGGYYFLPGKSDIINIRRECRRISLKKIKKARWIARLLSFIPGLKMIAICSNLGYLNADIEADIDFFIITAPGKIWTVRFWCALLMKLLNQRPTKRASKDKICLSYFVSSDNLNLEHTKISKPDIHLIYLLTQYLPIYSENNAWSEFIQANGWINQYLPNFNYYGFEAPAEHNGLEDRDKARPYLYGVNFDFLIKSRFAWLKKIVNLIQLPAAERVYRYIQFKIFPLELRQMMNRGDNKVIVNDKMLKLHTNDNREEYNNKLKIQNLINKTP